jgi:hypothetical protein
MPDEEKAAEGLAPTDEGKGEGDGAEKLVDEDWKAEVRREKEKLAEKLAEKIEERREEAGRRKLPPPDFIQFVSGIAAQTLMQMGDIENPISGGRRVDLESARYSIDLITMLEEKTSGNLTPDEERYLKAALHDLRMRYVEAVKAGPGESTPDSGPDATSSGDAPGASTPDDAGGDKG